VASQIPDLLVEHGRVKGDNIPLMNKSLGFTMNAPEDLDLPIFLIYNTGMPTLSALDFQNGWGKWPKYIKDNGDGTILSIGAEWICNKWDATKKPLVCVDLDRNDRTFDHQPLTKNSYIHELVFNATTQSDWVDEGPGRWHIRSPFVEIMRNGKYRIREDIRPMEKRKL
jgi:hypothetical protein